MNTPLTSAANLPQPPADIEAGADIIVMNTNTKLDTTITIRKLTIAYACGITVGVIISVLLIGACLFLPWILYVVWKYSKNPLDIAITSSIWVICGLYVTLFKFILATPKSIAEKTDVIRALEAWSLAMTAGLLTPAIVYSWLYFALPHSSYNVIVGNLLFAYGILESTIICVYMLVTLNILSSP